MCTVKMHPKTNACHLSENICVYGNEEKCKFREKTKLVMISFKIAFIIFVN